MEVVLKQTVGIDVAKDELVVCLARLNEDLSTDLYAHKSFSNDKKGFRALISWVKKHTNSAVEVTYVMEATGVYHEKLAYTLDDSGLRLSVVLPNKISNFARTLDIKTVTDKTASEAIALFGVQRKLKLWKRPAPIYRKLRQLTRERDQLVQEKTRVSNQLHAEKAEVEPNSSSVKRMNIQLRLFKKLISEIELEIKGLVKAADEQKVKVKRICTIPGVGFITAVTILAETDGFALIRSKRQLTSYAGLDVREKQSGTSIKGKPKISKRGNRHLRKVLYMPSLTAARFNEAQKDLYIRLISKHGLKKKAGVAVQRKILELSYILTKTEADFDPDYEAKKRMVEKKAEEQIIFDCSPAEADLKSL